MKFNNITKDNIKLYAASIYNNPGCSSLLEFEEDYLRVKYIKALINKYISNKQINVRILINHIICLSNVFPGEGVSTILYTEMEEGTWGVISVLLFYTSLLPLSSESNKTIYGKIICFSLDTISSADQNFLEYLRGL